MAYIGNAPASLITAVATDVFSANGTATAFTLSKAVTNTSDIQVVVDNIPQNPFSGSYSVSGATLTFSSVPASGSNNIVVGYRQATVALTAAAANSVSSSSLQPNSVSSISLQPDLSLTGNVTMAGTLTTASRSIAKASMPAGTVLQVVSTTKTDSFSTSATSMTDVTGLSVSITPTASTSKILVLLTLNLAGTNGNAGASYQLVRGSTAIAIGDVAGSRPQASGSIAYIADANSSTALSGSFLDSPATTSATTYKIQVVPGAAPSAGSAYVNRTQNDTNGTNFYNARTISTITVMEIAA